MGALEGLVQGGSVGAGCSMEDGRGEGRGCCPTRSLLPRPSLSFPTTSLAKFFSLCLLELSPSLGPLSI